MTLDEEMQVLLALAGPFHALGCFILSLVMTFREAPWSPRARIIALVVNAPIALVAMRAALAWTSNSWFAGMAYGLVAIDALGIALLARAAFKQVKPAKA